jgi:hypothetical protein
MRPRATSSRQTHRRESDYLSQSGPATIYCPISRQTMIHLVTGRNHEMSGRENHASRTFICLRQDFFQVKGHQSRNAKGDESRFAVTDEIGQNYGHPSEKLLDSHTGRFVTRIASVMCQTILHRLKLSANSTRIMAHHLNLLQVN